MAGSPGKPRSTSGGGAALGIYGRDLVVDRLAEAREAGRHSLVRGPSGIGKSTLLQAHHQNLKGRNVLCALHRVAGSYDAVDSAVHGVVEQLLAQAPTVGVSAEAIGKAILSAGKDNLVSFGTAALLDIVGAVAPSVARLTDQIVSGVKSQLSKQIPAAQLQSLQQATSPDALASLLAILKALSSLGNPGTLVFDQLEQASGTFNAFVLGLAREAPAGWTLAISVNDEDPAGVRWLTQHWPTLAYLQTVEITLGGLTTQSVENWYRQIWGRNPDPNELASVTTWCEGRPLLLRDWVEGRTTLFAMRDAWQRVGPYYDARVKQLSPVARELLQTLALLPSGQVLPFELMQVLLHNLSAAEVNDIVTELTDAGFLRQHADLSVWAFRHDVIHLQATRSLPSPVRRQFALNAAKAVRMAIPESSQKDLMLARLAIHSNEIEAAVELTITASTPLLSDGSFEAVEELVSLAKPLFAQGPIPDDLLMVRAEALYNLGRYTEALDELGAIRDQTPHVRLVTGRVLVRLNRYGEADDRLQEAIAGFSEASDSDGVSEALRSVNVILRDNGEYEAAADLARRLLCCLNESDDVLAAASLHRTAARSFALTSPRAAEVHARRAIELSASSLKDAGNGMLALGEALRHGGQVSSAAEAYARAGEVARSTGNVDSLLWSELGRGDCLLLLGEPSACRDSTRDLLVALEGDPSRHPLETLHFRFLNAVAAFLEGEAGTEALRVAAGSYAQLGLTWPGEYLRDLLASGRPQTAMRF